MKETLEKVISFITVLLLWGCCVWFLILFAFCCSYGKGGVVSAVIAIVVLIICNPLLLSFLKKRNIVVKKILLFPGVIVATLIIFLLLPVNENSNYSDNSKVIISNQKDEEDILDVNKDEDIQVDEEKEKEKNEFVSSEKKEMSTVDNDEKHDVVEMVTEQETNLSYEKDLPESGLIYENDNTESEDITVNAEVISFDKLCVLWSDEYKEKNVQCAIKVDKVFNNYFIAKSTRNEYAGSDVQDCYVWLEDEKLLSSIVEDSYIVVSGVIPRNKTMMTIENAKIIDLGDSAKTRYEEELEEYREWAKEYYANIKPEIKEERYVIQYGVVGICGKKDKFDRENYVRHYLPVGKYTATSLTSSKGTGFYVESIKKHKEDGYETTDVYETYRFDKEGSTVSFEIKEGQCVFTFSGTKMEVLKIE